ncbi:MAG: hypothetical protein FJW27_13720 [Acidimicrobiia bacterium]|nr:hypothetical protein [Acidimicrobiia bacterium]
MRSQILGIALAAVIAPHVGYAQVYLLPESSPPLVTAARAPWQLRGDAIFYKGDFYYPTGPTEFFDGRIMIRSGTHDGVPLYENTTLVPNDIVYVPVAGGLMRPYERRREGWFAGTTGSRMPSFVVEPRPTDLGQIERTWTERERAIARMAVGRAGWEWPEPVAPREVPPLATTPGRRVTAPPSGVIRSVPRRDTTNVGAYFSFEGARYVASGRAVRRDVDRFTRIGGIHDLAVFREIKGDPNTIYIESVPGGLLTPYSR